MTTCLTSETNEPPIQYRHRHIEVSRVGKGGVEGVLILLG